MASAWNAAVEACSQVALRKAGSIAAANPGRRKGEVSSAGVFAMDAAVGCSDEILKLLKR